MKDDEVILLTFCLTVFLLPWPGRRTLARSAVIVVLCLFGMVFTVTGAVWLREGIASRTWPTARAEVLKQYEQPLSGSHLRSGGVYYHEAVVVYRYTVGGQAYTGSRWMAGERHFYSAGAGSSAAAAHLRGVGSQVLISYDPRWPAAAVRRPGVATSTRTVLVAGAWLLFLAGVHYRQLRKQAPGDASFVYGLAETPEVTPSLRRG